MNIKDFIDKYDWEGLAKAYRESEISLSVEEWKEFVEEIRKLERERIKEKLGQQTAIGSQDWLKGFDQARKLFLELL